MRDVLSFEGVTKRFGGTVAVSGVTLSLGRGEILALLGENGAGKSTLIKCLAGIHTPDEGRILVDGTPYRHLDAKRDARPPVAFIHQDLGLIDWMTVAENIALGVGYGRRRGIARGLIDWRATRERAVTSLETLGAGIDPDERIMALSRTERSLVAIARALASDAAIIVLDEPTASLPADEVDRLLATLRSLRETGVAMIYVSHRLDEVFAVADRVAVLRDGRLVACEDVADIDPAGLVTAIVGTAPSEVFTRAPAPTGPVRLRLDHFETAVAGPVDLALRGGEIVGLVGLRGAGQEAIGRALFGAATITAGRASLDETAFRPLSPGHAIADGVGLLAGDRVGESLGMSLTIRENMFLNPGALGRRLLQPRAVGRECDEAQAAGARMGLRPNEPRRPVETLSGGNQQKVVLARWLAIARRVLVLEEPTAGVDVGAKAEIYGLLRDALAGGLAILVVSTDFEEVANICHRALVLSRGAVVAEIDGDALSVASLLAAASAGTPGHDGARHDGAPHEERAA